MHQVVSAGVQNLVHDAGYDQQPMSSTVATVTRGYIMCKSMSVGLLHGNRLACGAAYT